MTKKLVVVDNVIKSRTVWSALKTLEDASSWIVIDYPVPPTDFPKKFVGGTNANGGFEPQLVTADKDRLARIIDVCRDCSLVYMFFDPTLEGEESAVYLLNAISPYIDFNKVYRVRSNLLTRGNILKSVDNPVSFDHFSADKSESLRTLDRVIQFGVNNALGGKVIYDSTVGMCGYYILKLVLDRFIERYDYKSLLPDFKVAIRARNKTLIRSVDTYLKREAAQVVEKTMKWLGTPRSEPKVAYQEQEISAPKLYQLESLVLDCLKDGSIHLSSVMETLVALFHEGYITNPYFPKKVPSAYSADIIEYIKSFGGVPSDTLPSRDIGGIIPIDIRFDMNKINKNYRPVYRKIWQRTIEAHGIPTLLRKNTVELRPKLGHIRCDFQYSGEYFDLLTPGFMGYFKEVNFEPQPDDLLEVVLDKQESKRPQHHTEYSVMKDAIDGKVFSPFDIQRSIAALQAGGFIRTGTSNFLVPTFRGLLVGFAVFKSVPALGQLAWLQESVTAISQPRAQSRIGLSTIWKELKDPLQLLDKHKFVCQSVCPSCKASLDVIFDKEREPYLLCKKLDSGGCGAVYPLGVNSAGEIKVFEPYSLEIPCPKCELSTMRCHNGPYGLFIRCDSCNSTQPFD